MDKYLSQKGISYPLDAKQVSRKITPFQYSPQQHVNMKALHAQYSHKDPLSNNEFNHPCITDYMRCMRKDAILSSPRGVSQLP